MESGDFSIVYKACGFLEDVKTLITARSNFKKSILDTLHLNQVEIVSPTFVNQRPQKEGAVFIPQGSRILQPGLLTEEKKAAEEIIFDKAEEAEAEAFIAQEESDADDPEKPKDQSVL